MNTRLIPEVPAHRPAIEFDYDHSAPILAGSHIVRGDRAEELRMIRDAADGFIAAVKGDRNGLCPALSENRCCTRRAGHDGPHICASVRVVAHDIWTDWPRVA